MVLNKNTKKKYISIIFHKKSTIKGPRGIIIKHDSPPQSYDAPISYISHNSYLTAHQCNMTPLQ